jgi:hypothetical protein
MKKLILTGVLVISLFTGAIGQVGINNDNSAPDQSAGLDVKFEDKGFLPPRVTTAQMVAIPNPVEGLVVYNTSLHSLAFYNGTGWKSTDGQHFIGERFGGGVIFYLDGTGQHGMIAAGIDQDMGEFGCYPMEVGGTSTLFGTGQANTTQIVNFCPMPGAARICDDLVLNGYSDWFLPSLDELVEMCNQRDAIGVFADGWYWTSSECNASEAKSHTFEIWNYNYCRGKYDNSHVRAVRVF